MASGRHPPSSCPSSSFASPVQRQDSSASSCLEHAPSSRGIPAVFHSPQASEPPFFAWPKKNGPKKGHPTFAPCAQSLCSRCASLLRGSPTVHPWTGFELAHIVWAILRTCPSQSRRDRGDPLARVVRARAMSKIKAAFGNCFVRCPRRLFPTPVYLPHPWGRSSWIPAVVIRRPGRFARCARAGNSSAKQQRAVIRFVLAA